MENLENEIWKPVVGFEGYYEVSNLCRIRNLPRIWKNGFGGEKLFKSKIMRPNTSTQYHRYGLRIHGGKQHYFLAHRLLMMAFVPNPMNYPQVNHINGIKTDNRIENLEWCNNSQNIIHSLYTLNNINKQVNGERQHFSKLTKADVIKIRDEYPKRGNISQQKFADRFGVSRTAINSVIKNITWKHI